MNSLAHATFNASSFSSNFSLDKSIVSINKFGPSIYVMRSTSLKKMSPLLFFTESSSFNIPLKHFILFNQHALILKLETLAENVPTMSF